VRNVEEPAAEVELRAHELWRADGDHRWQVITCQRGMVWITQRRDVRDYVLEAGEVFVITLPGAVLVQALDDACIQLSPSLRAKPYTGDYRFFS
jgi:hypothetical protein